MATDAMPRRLPSLRLYSLPLEWEAVNGLLDESGGEITPEIDEILERLSVDTPTAIEYLGRLVKGRQATADVLEHEQRELRQRANEHRRAASLILDRIRFLHVQSGHKRLDGDTVASTLVENAHPEIAWTGDPDDIPLPFRRVSVELAKSKAVEHLRNNGSLPDGFEVKPGQPFVRLRYR